MSSRRLRDAVELGCIAYDLARLLFARSEASAAERANRLHERAINLHAARRKRLAAATAQAKGRR